MLDEYVKLIRSWARSRGILNNSDVTAMDQYRKLVEEVEELGEALERGDFEGVVDGIGDVFVVLVVLSSLLRVELQDCVREVYDVIKNRTGRVINGQFVKDE